MERDGRRRRTSHKRQAEHRVRRDQRPKNASLSPTVNPKHRAAKEWNGRVAPLVSASAALSADLTRLKFTTSSSTSW